MIRHAVIAAAIAAALAGCQTRYDAFGNRIYFLQFNQSLDRSVDYSDPRLPILPPLPARDELWPRPSPYQFRDLSQYSYLAPSAPLNVVTARVGDNRRCAAACDSNARLALVASRADARDDGRASTAR
jgi:hypothetical protein